MRLDFLGPPAVGKSTLIRAILASLDNVSPTNSERRTWVSMERAVRLAEENVFRRGIPPMTFSQRIAMFFRVLRHGVHDYLWYGYKTPFRLKEIDSVQKAILVSFLERQHALFVAFVEQWFDIEMVLPPLALRYQELLTWTSDWLFANTWAGPVGILADNSRLTKGIAELLSNEKYGGEAVRVAERFFLSELAPAALVHIEGDPQLVLERLHHRANETTGRRHPAHRDLSDEEVLAYTARRNEVNATAVRLIRSWGIPVLTLHASSALGGNAKLVHKFLDELTEHNVREVSSSPTGEPACLEG